MKRENYLLENFTNEFENDIVFARYINYMKKALLNRKLDFLKHQKYINQKEQTISDEEWTILSNKGNSVHSFFNVQNNIGFESSIELKIAIDKLTEKQKQIIILHYYNKKPLNVIAKELKMKDSAVRQLKYKAIIKLKKYMEGK
jgi:RNA polymerase sigma factor (sigma-70 family)